MKNELTKKEEIIKALDELKDAMLAKLDADTKYEKASVEVKSAYYTQLKARQRLETINM